MNKQKDLSKSKHVIVINDDITQIKFISETLEKLGFIVHPFKNPLETLLATSSIPHPDLIISDIHLADINGWGLCRFIRSKFTPWSPDTPIILTSSIFIGHEFKNEARIVGANEFIELPVEPDELTKTIEKVFKSEKIKVRCRLLFIAPLEQIEKLSIEIKEKDDIEATYCTTLKESLDQLSTHIYEVITISYKIKEDFEPLFCKIGNLEQKPIVFGIVSEIDFSDFYCWLGRGLDGLLVEPINLNHLMNLYERIRLEKILINTRENIEKKVKENLNDELKWASVLDVLPCGVFIKDKKLNYVKVNKAFAEFFDKEPYEILRINDSSLFEEESMKMFIEACHIALQGTTFKHSELSLHIKSKNKLQTFNVHITPFKNSEGVIEGIVGSLLEITELKEAIVNYTNLFYSMQEAFAEHEMIYDEQGNPIDYRFIKVNPVFETMTGLKPEEVIGKRVREVLPNLEHFWINTYGHVVKTGRAVTFINFTTTLNRYYLVHAYKTGKDRFACIFTDITEKKKYEEEIKKLNREWQLAYENINSVIWFLDKEYTITRTNTAVKKILNLAPEEVLCRKCWEFVHKTKEPPYFCPVAKTTITRKRETLELQEGNKWYEIIVDPVLNEFNQLSGFVHILSDITERKRLEQEREELQKQLFQSQKLDAIGKLAGGIAHDFNNMLSAIMGNIELAIMKTETNDPIRDNLYDAHHAVERASALTQKILAFARKQTSQPRVINFNTQIEEQLKLLIRTIPERIKIEFQPGDNLWDVYMDPTHLDSIVLNLCINARDAIPENGKIIIETKNVSFTSESAKKTVDAQAGDYVLLSVSDTGTGIHPDILPHIFEPFFTTKPQDKGSGLGLPTVYGTVKQNNGFITVESEWGKGTTFKIYIPKNTEKIKDVDTDLPKNQISSQDTPLKGEILIIEDEKNVLDILGKIAFHLGLEPLLADEPLKAIELAEKNKEKIRMIISDIILPKMNGFDLVNKIKKIIPDVKTLFISGYAEELIPIEKREYIKEINYIKKPFSIHQITQKIREILS